MTKKWTGPVDTCNICHSVLTKRFIDGLHRCGSWAIMCPTCHAYEECGLGTGKGQLYEKKEKDWIKING